MVQAIIDIEDYTNRILNMIKAKFGLKDKSAAINMMAQHYEQELLEPQLRPEYTEKLAKIIRGKHLSRNEFDKEV
jgi:hypothetical protein